ncbi:class I SAM-dependent DNA methyltransferase [Corynebacterium sp. HMSC064E08]|uniref:HsdM family class I SAM-dependent methyltransferase n=1 Tax=Corynebacterium sp. HMSC064E08 TaxID=1739324 RepID=UPI0008A13E66|nr:class I SAM-dependent DNA methyltransferase [Corynebacterium sp. HMSC064E08]OFK31566.1 N-6 DNA methylase [Corynebacterium sp. HMSC064E08]
MAVKKTELYSLLWEAANKLRGGVEPARYKDYVLTLLFFKYVSDRYKGQRYGDFIVEEGASFDDLIAAKGKKDIGERVDKILSAFMEENQLQGSLPEVSFNNEDELGRGKELVDKVTGLIAVFENPAIDFKTNRASGDDIIGDAYEYFMMKFAQESGKSKGQFYTPSEVSQIMARLVGIAHIGPRQGRPWTLYDPAAGSGSLLIRAADEAPVNRQGNAMVSIYGQEKDNATAGLAKMNLVLHQKGTGEIKTHSTLTSPQYLDEYGQLRKFDFIVMNPPFSDKSWSDGITPENDVFHRFDGYGIPPEKNGDWAWFLHVLKSLTEDGKAAIIMPHGILFRGNAEETIRKQVLARKYITGIVSLPANLFYGTGIPACIVVVDKENADNHEGIFMIDASQGFKKDGNKNRLREQDIERIVQTYNLRREVDGYSRMVSYEEILEDNGGNLNVPRYIQRPSTELPQDIAAHLQGGIPAGDLDSLAALWKVAPNLKQRVFAQQDSGRFTLLFTPDELATRITADEMLIAQEIVEVSDMLASWAEACAKPALLGVNRDTHPRLMIREAGEELLDHYADAKVLDPYDVFDVVMNYWNARLQDDVYIIKASGFLAGREVEYDYKQKKAEDGQKTDTGKIKGFEGLLIPAAIIEAEYFPMEQEQLAELDHTLLGIEADLESLLEEQPEEDNPFAEVLSSTGKVLEKELNARLKALDDMKRSSQLDVLNELIDTFTQKNMNRVDRLLEQHPDIAALNLYGKTGKPIKTKLKKARQELSRSAPVPEAYQDEYEALAGYRDRLDQVKALRKQAKAARDELDKKVIARYGTLTEDEIKHLLFDRKWMPHLQSEISSIFDQQVASHAARITDIARRYERTLPEIEAAVERSRASVTSSLESMGYTW